jgi:hypothetical protein
MSEYTTKPKRKSRRSFIWPIILITIGLVFLLSNLGLLGENVWDNIWRLWPVIFIAIGLDSLFRRNEIAGPVFMIGLGLIFLLSSLRLIGWGAWDILWRLWPVLLVSVGLEIIVGRRSLWISILIVLVILAGLGGVIWFYGSGPVAGESMSGNQVNQILGDIGQADVTISPAAGDLNVEALKDSKSLVRGEVSTGRNQEVYTDYEISGSTGYFKVDSWSMVNFPGSGVWDWDLALTDKVPLNLELTMGAGDMNADLAGIILTDLNLSQGVGQLTVLLTDKGDYRAEINQAIGSIEVGIPKGTGVRIEVSKAISSLSMPSGLEKRGGYYYSPNYDQADQQIELDISQAIGSIVLNFE